MGPTHRRRAGLALPRAALRPLARLRNNPAPQDKAQRQIQARA
jgi:hypothetical protein